MGVPTGTANVACSLDEAFVVFHLAKDTTDTHVLSTRPYTQKSGYSAGDGDQANKSSKVVATR